MINLSLTDLTAFSFVRNSQGSYWSMWIKVAWCVITTYQMKQLSPQGNHYRKSQNVPE